MVVNKPSLPYYGRAPQFQGIEEWLNTESPISLNDLRGKVILVDFWTYTCINCIRVMPHVSNWHERYRDKGLVVIGIHSPEFEFEKEPANVRAAIDRFKIEYPVGLDNRFKTWKAYNNQYWPAHYLIDTQGFIRSSHFGEGQYNQTEIAIRKLLEEAGIDLDIQPTSFQESEPKLVQTPELYLGLERIERFASNEKPIKGRLNYTLSKSLPPHYFAFQGEWNIQDQSSETKNNAFLELNFYANKIFMVITPGSKEDIIEVSLDGLPLDESNAGKDIKLEDSSIKFDVPRLYNIISLKSGREQHVLHLESKSPGIKLYAITFG